MQANSTLANHHLPLSILYVTIWYSNNIKNTESKTQNIVINIKKAWNVNNDYQNTEKHEW